MSLKSSKDYRACNHHHEPTDRHRVVTIGGKHFVANVEAIPLLEALNGLGLETRTHHIADGCENAFVSIMLDDVSIEVRKVNEVSAGRTAFNGRHELLIQWHRPDQDPQ